MPKTNTSHHPDQQRGTLVEHVVFFPAHDGTPAFRRVGSLEDAVRLVEHLRNVEGINEVSVHALAEVPLAFRTVIKVEVPGAVDTASLVPAQPVVEEAPVPAVVEAPALVEVAAVDAPVVDAPVLEAVPALDEPELASANGRGDGAKSLGFFS
ncbi:MAG: hypothetical protein Q8R60_14655 [Mycobacteriales bacterium]|nr:hypothetical protein [Mycobacteriales bacterium]